MSVVTSEVPHPRRIVVAAVNSSRYKPGTKPLSWDKRSPGIESITTKTGETITLFSGGGQASPEAGWELLLMREAQPDELATAANPAQAGTGAFTWTLYGIKP